MIIHDYRSKNRILSWSLLTTIILGTEFEPSTFVSRESIAKKTKIRYEVIKSGRKVSKVDTHYSKLKKERGPVGQNILPHIRFSFPPPVKKSLLSKIPF